MTEQTPPEGLYARESAEQAAEAVREGEGGEWPSGGREGLRVMAKSYRVLVTGSRDWDDERLVWQAIASTIIENVPPPTPIVIVHGACPRGADAHAAAWAHLVAADGRRPVTEERHPADWQQHGKAAGFRRNAEMVALGADICLAFIRNGSRGASHTAALAEQAGIPTLRYTA